MPASKAPLWKTAAVLAALATSLFGSDSSSVAYLGQTPPGRAPEIFGLGLVSSDAREASMAFTPDGKELYFARFEPSVGYTIMVTRQTDDGWTEPRTAPFSGSYSEVDPFVTATGDELYYISKRPSVTGGERSRAYRIWVLERNEQGWGQARILSGGIDSGHRELYPTLSKRGTLVFGSGRPGGIGGSDLYVATRTADGFSIPRNLGASINSTHDETDALIAPDESFIVFTSVDRADGFGNGDLYVSFKTENGTWSEARNMGSSINTASSEFCPNLSPDGAYLFFTSGRRGNDDIYWVDARVIREHASQAADED